jgi:hypothetical protein
MELLVLQVLMALLVVEVEPVKPVNKEQHLILQLQR